MYQSSYQSQYKKQVEQKWAVYISDHNAYASVNIHGILMQESECYAVLSVLTNSLEQSSKESNICSVGYACYGIPEFTVVLQEPATGPCLEPGDPSSYLDLLFLYCTFGY